MTQSRIPRLLMYFILFVCVLGNSISRLDAGESVYSVSNILVDVSAESSAIARSSALINGQYIAFNKLCNRIVIAEDIQFLESISSREIEEMIGSYIIEKELLSSTRYRARLTFNFNKEFVRTFFQTKQIRFAEARSKERLVLPILELPNGERVLWQEPKTWSDSWLLQANNSELVPLILPLGDITDIELISPQASLIPSWDKLLPLANRYKVEEVIIVLAKAKINNLVAKSRSDGKNVELDVGGHNGNAQDELKSTGFNNMLTSPILLQVYTHFVNARGGDRFKDVLESKGGERFNDILLRGAIETAKSIQEKWKKNNVLEFGSENTMRIFVPLSDLRDWIQIRAKLGNLGVVRNIDMISLSRLRVELILDYLGRADQLVTALKQLNLQLTYGLEGWVLMTTNDSKNTKSE